MTQATDTYDEQNAAKTLAALGHEARLRIFRLLVRAGDEGLSVGDIGMLLAVPPSTLAHHLSALVSAELVVQERQGRIIRNRIQYDRMNALLSYLSDDCCAGVAAPRSDDVA